MHTASDLKEKMAAYRATARKREAGRQEQLAQRREWAWLLARRGAALLKERFGARRVVAFGSLDRDDLFHIRSDVDLAVWGLAAENYYRAVGCLLALDSRIETDLVMVETAPPGLCHAIEQEGVDL